jgi:hypothetical protein
LIASKLGEVVNHQAGIVPTAVIVGRLVAVTAHQQAIDLSAAEGGHAERAAIALEPPGDLSEFLEAVGRNRLYLDAPPQCREQISFLLKKGATYRAARRQTAPRHPPK